MAYGPFSPYSTTKFSPAGYLDVFSIRPVPAASTDILYEITPAYTHRPDLLAHDLYGKRELWWIFAQRNMDILKDPVYDFLAGTKIYLPQGQHLKDLLGS